MTLHERAYLEGHPVERHSHHSVGARRRRAMVAEAAYFLAQHRGFAPGRELDDWLQAECEIERMLFDVSRLPERP